MPSQPHSHSAETEPPPQVTNEAIKGFITGAARYGSISLLAHLLLILPHPLPFNTPTAPTTTNTSTSHPSNHHSHTPRRPLLLRPLAALSSNLAPLSRIYRPLTPQFKVYIQLSAMIVGGCVWAEKRVGEYMEAIRRGKRIEGERERKRLMLGEINSGDE